MVRHVLQADERLAITVTKVRVPKLAILCRRPDCLVAAELIHYEGAVRHETDGWRRGSVYVLVSFEEKTVAIELLEHVYQSQSGYASPITMILEGSFDGI